MKTKAIDAVNGNVGIGAGTISKNEAKPESHTSRGKPFIKTKLAVWFFAAGMILGSTSCDFVGNLFNSSGNAVKSGSSSSIEKDAKRFAELYWECAIAEFSIVAGAALELFFIVDDCLSDEFIKRNETGSSVKCKEFAGFMKKMKAKYNDKSNEFTVLVKKEIYNIRQRGTQQ